MNTNLQSILNNSGYTFDMDKNEVKLLLDQITKQSNTLKSARAYLKNNFKSEKEFAKALLLEYLTVADIFIKEKGEYSLLGISRTIKDEKLEKLLLLLTFNQNLDINEKVKLVKNCDINIADLILNEKISYESFLLLTDKFRHVDINDLERKEEISDIFTAYTLYMNLLLVIKIIKFGLGKAHIAYFDDKSRIKKVIKPHYKFIGSIIEIGLVKAFDKDDIDYDGLVNRMKNERYSDRREATYSLANKVNDYVMNYENDRLYTKYLLGPEYKELIKSPITHTSSNTINILIKKGAMAKRKVLVPKNGVVLKVEGDSHIDSILIREIPCEFSNNLVIVVRNHEGKELVNTIFLNLNLYADSIYFEHSELSVSSLAYVYDFLGIKEHYKDIKEFYQDKDVEISYEAISPYYWKYRGLYSAPEDRKDANGVVIERAYELEIGHFIRKIRGTAGKEAQNLAKKLCVELADGHTIVKSHKRTYKRKAILK